MAQEANIDPDFHMTCEGDGFFLVMDMAPKQSNTFTARLTDVVNEKFYLIQGIRFSASMTHFYHPTSDLLGFKVVDEVGKYARSISLESKYIDSGKAKFGECLFGISFLSLAQ